MDYIKLKAYGKINLGLDVLSRREDGYHEVKMIMQTVNIYDNILIKKNNTGKINIKTNLYYLPNNEKNIMYKATKLLFEEFSIKEGIDITLKKNIPVSAGMAGGSADAAAVFVGLNKLFKLKLSQQELMKRAVIIGADVPFCIMRGTALSEGIGEKLSRLESPPKCYVLIAKLGFGVSTKFVYQNLELSKIERHPDIDGIVEAIKNNDLNQMANKIENVLESVTVKEYPVIEEIKNTMKENGAICAVMSGSGPTVFGLYTDKKDINKAYYALKEIEVVKQQFVTRFFNI